MKKNLTLFARVIIIAGMFTGCSSNDNTIQTCIISNTSYTSQSEMESAVETDTLTAEKPVYASIHFVESPKGMEYSVTWYLDQTEIKSETKTTKNHTQDIIIYELESEHAVKGTLEVVVIYKDTTLLTKELEIQ